MSLIRNTAEVGNIQDNHSQRSRQDMFSTGFSVDESCFDKIRSSPSVISNSEPPSYFEALGITPNSVILNTDGNSITLQTQLNNNQNLDKPPTIFAKELSYSSETKPSSNQPQIPTIFYNNISCPYYQRHHVFRNQNVCDSNQNNIPSALRLNSEASNMQKPSETYLVWSIFTTIYCVFVGIFALILSIRVAYFNKQGNFDKAHRRAKIARNFNIAGLFFGIVYMAIGIITCLLPRA